MALEKVALDGRFVRLEPLEERHRAAIRPAAQHPEIFTVTTSAHLEFGLLSPARGRGWVRGLCTSSPPHLASPPDVRLGCGAVNRAVAERAHEAGERRMKA